KRLRRRHFEWKRIPKVVVCKRIANQNGDGVRFLASGATCAPDPEGVITAFLFAAQDFLKNGFLQEIELRAIAKETGFVDGQILEQESKFSAPFPAGKQAVVGIERVKLAGFQAALEAILEEVRAALIEKHAAFLIDQRLKELQLRFRELDLGGYRSHFFVKQTRRPAVPVANRKRHYLRAATGSAASSSRLNSGRCKSFEMSSRMMRRPLSLPTPVT